MGISEKIQDRLQGKSQGKSYNLIITDDLFDYYTEPERQEILDWYNSLIEEGIIKDDR